MVIDPLSDTPDPVDPLEDFLAPPEPAPPRRYIMGVDPGLSGALALLDAETHAIVEILDTPVILTPTRIQSRYKKLKIDLPKLAQWIKEKAPQIDFAMVEKVHSMTHQGVVSVFTFGKAYGEVCGILAASGIRTIYVAPPVWKAKFNLSSNKLDSFKLGNKIWPNECHRWTRVKDDGRVEAALIAYFGATQI